MKNKNKSTNIKKARLMCVCENKKKYIKSLLYQKYKRKININHSKAQKYQKKGFSRITQLPVENITGNKLQVYYKSGISFV